jgi:hypothetical protein
VMIPSGNSCRTIPVVARKPVRMLTVKAMA